MAVHIKIKITVNGYKSVKVATFVLSPPVTELILALELSISVLII